MCATWAGVAAAADQPEYAPPPAWVKPAAIPKTPAPTDGSPTQMLLVDEQSRLGPDGDEIYVERALKILSPQGFNISGALAKTWDPDTETLVIHRLNIIRGDTVIDALAGGKKFIVLRRENNLELAMLDGRLTAAIQPEGLEIGDIVDIATTVRRRDPALQGYSSDMDRLTHTGVASRIRMRAVWPSSKPIRWRTTDGLDAPKVTKGSDGSELVIDMAGVETPKPPAGAPMRFADLGSLELSQYGDWSELSRSMAPLYQKASVLTPGSPLAAEVAKIAAASPDPKARATAALRLVEDQTRYVFLGMNDGGLVPAEADQTWARRFGDCKGKTALLVALLRGLGIDAEPALVSTAFGDGLDQHLPMADWFDHVIVRARIGGQTYWLDGTRVGDRNIDDLVVPPFRWALPVQTDGATLVRLEPAVLTQPNSEELMKIDASQGGSAPSPAHIEILYRGESAAANRQALASVPRSDYERYLREFWTKTYPWLTVSSVSAVQDPVANVSRLTADGFATLEWAQNPDGTRYYRVPYTTMGADVSFKREPGPHQDAPYSVMFPYSDKRVKQIVLPTNGDFVLVGDDIDKRVSGLALHRHARIDGGVLTIEMTTEALDREFPAQEAEAAGKTLRELAKKDVSFTYKIRSGPALAVGGPPAPAVNADQAAAERGDAAAQFRLAQMYGHGRGVPLNAGLAVYWLKASADQGYAPAETGLGWSYFSGAGEPRDLAAALAWMQKAAAQNNPEGEAGLAFLYSTGSGVPRDDAKAMAWAQKAADQNLASAEELLGQLYVRRGAADLPQAIAWFQKAADQGLPAAEVHLALAYQRGLGVTKDPARSLAWARKAADAGDAGGELFLSDMYKRGDGVKQDGAEALAWLRKAADRGDLRAERMLGQAYLNGDSVPADKDQAMVWFGKAAAAGDVVSQQTLAALSGHPVVTAATPPPAH
ncbi:MAG: DUF3857 domain-containing protein [Caulobacteraceae bacterium]|nr:DUF3857 domain-containing protein [Caulobacteraceae bacterium]